MLFFRHSVNVFQPPVSINNSSCSMHSSTSLSDEMSNSSQSDTAIGSSASSTSTTTSSLSNSEICDYQENTEIITDNKITDAEVLTYIYRLE